MPPVLPRPAIPTGGDVQGYFPGLQQPAFRHQSSSLQRKRHVKQPVEHPGANHGTWSRSNLVMPSLLSFNVTAWSLVDDAQISRILGRVSSSVSGGVSVPQPPCPVWNHQPLPRQPGAVLGSISHQRHSSSNRVDTR